MAFAPRMAMPRHLRFALAMISCLVPLQCATLERLTLAEMIEQSTAIVRGRVVDLSPAISGGTVYTVYRVEVTQRWKGPDSATVDVRVPGGRANGIRQICDGAPQLAPGKEYVLFLWTSRTGATYIIGFSQGVFELPGEGDNRMAVRAASRDIMLEPRTGRPVRAERIELRLAELSARISANLAGGATR